MKIIICGDIHGMFKTFTNFIELEKPDVIIQCGDMAIGPYFDDYDIHYHGGVYKFTKIKNNDTKIYFCPGNHENWDYLDSLENNEISPNIFYMKKGSILKLNNKNILFMGGADSIDKKQRTIKVDWFTQEIITEEDIYNLPDIQIDIVISHTCPEVISDLIIDDSCNDPSRIALNYVLEKYNPTEWFFGHFHKFKIIDYYGCRFTMLNKITDNGWYIKWLQ